MNRSLIAHIESWPAKIPFRIANHVWHTFDSVVCEIAEDGCVGRGEGMTVYYQGETESSLLAQVESVQDAVEAGATREELLTLLPPGGARNAVDAALWDIESQMQGFSVWQRAAGKSDVIQTVFTIGLEKEPEEMAAKAAAAADYSLFKIKLNSDRPVERVTAIREVQPNARLVIDANQGWDFAQLTEVAPELAELGVEMIEQPLPRGDDAELEHYEPPLPLCSDESCLHLGELEANVPRYQMINIKLDKAGGLTHSLELAAAAREHGLGLMVGCMGGTSIAMAPSHVLAQLCDLVDIDGPLLLRQDRPRGLVYDNGMVSLPKKPFWGMPR